MKKIFNITLLLLMVLGFSLTSCDKEEPFQTDDTDGKATGTVSFRKMMVEVRNEENIVRAADVVDVNAFLVTVTDTRTSQAVWSGTYGSMPEVLTLPVGSYDVSVNSADNPDAGWDTPYFEGGQSFTVAADAITTVEPIVCRLANVKVTVIFDEKLKAKMGPDCKVTVVACDRGRLEFTVSETRSGYFKYIEKDGSQPTMVATFSGTVDENYEENFRTYTEVAPGNHYKITYTLKGVEPDVPEQTGTVTPGLYVDATVNRVDMTIDVNADDDIIPDDQRPYEGNPDEGDDPKPEGPVPSVTANDGILLSDPDKESDAPNTYAEGMTVVISVHSEAAGGITGFTVDIDSNTLTAEELEGVGLAPHLDLVNPGEFADKLSGLGFPVNVGGMTDPAAMNLSGFMPMLQALGAGTHKFNLVVTDANGTTKKRLTIVTL